jgi:hypothetical protein
MLEGMLSCVLGLSTAGGASHRSVQFFLVYLGNTNGKTFTLELCARCWILGHLVPSCVFVNPHASGWFSSL